MLLCFVELDSFTSDNYVRRSINDNHRRQNSSPGVYLLPSGLLQLHSVRHVRRPSAEGSVHSERRCTSGHRSSTMWPHHAGTASAASAACPSTSRVQGCMPGTPVAGWSDTRIRSRRHPTRYGQWSSSATFSRRQHMPRPTDAQQLRRSKLQCCRPPHVEQFTTAPATRHELCAFQASTENISIRELVNHGALWLFA